LPWVLAVIVGTREKNYKEKEQSIYHVSFYTIKIQFLSWETELSLSQLMQ